LACGAENAERFAASGATASGCSAFSLARTAFWSNPGDWYAVSLRVGAGSPGALSNVVAIERLT
jgi:hypothetical protein